MDSLKTRIVRAQTGLAYLIVAALSMCMLGGTAAVASAAEPSAANAGQRLANIKSKGDQEITRRLNSLNTLTNKINAASKLTASDKQTLTAEVTAEINGLTALKTKLDSDTTVEAAIADAKAIYNDYRVYALVLPKAALVRNADDQLVTEQKLATLAQKLQTRITAAAQAGKSVATLQAQLSDMQAKISAAQAISTSIQASVIPLQPSDYNGDHAVLSGDAARLKAAHQDNQDAYADAKAIVAALKSLT